MSVGAIVMMIIGCTALWGGCAVAVTFAIKSSKKNAQ